MKVLALLVCLIGISLAVPVEKPKYGNADESGSFFQGDIRLPLPKMNKNGLINESYRWPGGKVPYIFYKGFFSDYEEDVILQGMAQYATDTNGCITFSERVNETNYISFINAEDGCWSYVGMQGGEQEINYPTWCINQYGSVLHEMLHALGFFHEQSRYDRDDYVIIHYENIQSGAEGNFDKYSQLYISGFGYDYDYGSVMHYSGTAFSINGEVTIETIDPAYQDVIGQRDGFSASDLGKLMKMYNCPGTM